MTQKSKINTFTKNTAWIYLGKIGSQILAFITAVLVIKKLDVDMYGTYNLLLKFIILFNVFSLSPIGSVFNRYIPELISNNENRRLTKLIFTGISLIVISAIAIATIMLNFSDILSGFLNIPSFAQYKVALLAYIMLMILRQAMVSILTSSLLHKQTSIFLLFSSFIRSVLLIALLPFLTINVLLLIEAIASFIYILPGGYVLYKFIVSVKAKAVVETKVEVDKKRVIRYGMFSSLNELGAGIVGKTSDYFIISSMSNLHNVGIYAFATKIYDLIFKLLPFKEFMTVVRPLFFQKYSNDYNESEFHNVYNFMIKCMMPVYIIPVLYFVVFGQSLIQFVFDAKYAEAYLVCVLVLLSNVYYAFFFPVALVMQLKEKMDIALYSKVIVFFSIAAGILAMKYYGIIGVAIATLVGDLSKNFFILILLKRKVKIKYRLNEYRNYLFVFAGINIPFFMISYYNINFPFLVIGTLIYFPLTLWSIVKFHPFKSFDLELLEKMGQSNKSTKLVRKLILKIQKVSL